MALQVWLPLNGNLDNQGLSNITVINHGATVNDNGKIGKCYSFDGSSQFLQFSDSLGDIYSGDFSWALWIKPIDDTRGVLISEYSSSGASNVALELYTNRRLRVWWSGSPDYYPNYSLPKDIWTHLTVTKTTNLIKVYINGELLEEKSATLSNRPSTSKIRIGDDYRGGTSVSYMGYLNDVRIYDHCLSPKEIREISKGLVLHYKLDGFSGNGIGGVNLVTNGWGGTDNWVYKESPYISSDVPSSPTGMTNSYGGNNITKDYIELIPNHSYTISGWVKKNSSSANICFISLVPYDIDKLRISSVQQPDYFRFSSLTTLSQDLKDGDTIVHLTDASGWASPTTYQYYLAIFGYKDSTGYVYPDLVYTRRVYAFGTTTDKSNLDISNNQVTLLSAYSGKTIPSGTSVCLSCAGNAYYYPITTSASNATDWIFQTKTFTPNSVNYLKAAKYVKIASVETYQWITGITLTDNTAPSIIEDVSGYNNDSNIVGTLNMDFNSPRYNCSYKFIDGTSYISRNSIIGEIKTISVWVKTSKSKSTSQIICTDANSKMGISFYNGCIISYMGTSGYSTGSKCTLGSSYIENGWNHFVVIDTGNGTRDVYCNNVKLIPTTNDYWSSSAGLFVIGRRIAGIPFYGQISDFRVYSTILSESDIEELYNTSAFIDNHGNLDCFEINETDETQPNILKNGEVDSYNFMETHPYLYLPAGSSVDSGLYYNAGDTCKAETIIRYSGGSGRDLMGYSASGGGYWGVKADGTWEPHGTTFTYTNSDINVVNHISYTFHSATEKGTYVIGKLANTYSVRDKYIYRVRLYRNGILERDLHPLVENSVYGLFDILNGVFYPSSGSGVTMGYEEEDNIARIYQNHVKSNQIIEI